MFLNVLNSAKRGKERGKSNKSIKESDHFGSLIETLNEPLFFSFMRYLKIL